MPLYLDRGLTYVAASVGPKVLGIRTEEKSCVVIQNMEEAFGFFKDEVIRLDALGIERSGGVTLDARGRPHHYSD